MHARINSPVMTIPGALEGLRNIAGATEDCGIPRSTLDLVELRASQINGCSVCLDMHTRGARKRGETDQRLFTVAAWREAPYFNEAERAALALTEAVTRIADRPDPVPDDVWQEAAKHYDERALGGLVMSIAMINLWNRLNVSTKNVAGDWTEQWS